MTPGEGYQIEVQGLRTADGKPLPLSWRTVFCSLGAAITKATLMPPTNNPSASFTFATNMPLRQFSWWLRWMLADGSGRYYNLGSGQTGPLAAGRYTIPLPIALTHPQAQGGEFYRLVYEVTDQDDTFIYATEVPAQ